MTIHVTDVAIVGGGMVGEIAQCLVGSEMCIRDRR